MQSVQQDFLSPLGTFVPPAQAEFFAGCKILNLLMTYLQIVLFEPPDLCLGLLVHTQLIILCREQTRLRTFFCPYCKQRLKFQFPHTSSLSAPIVAEEPLLSCSISFFSCQVGFCESWPQLSAAHSPPRAADRVFREVSTLSASLHMEAMAAVTTHPHCSVAPSAFFSS